MTEDFDFEQFIESGKNSYCSKTLGERTQEQLLKAKELLKEALDKIDCVEHSSWWDKAEKFLKESE